jgi:hypothetical protein
MLVLSIYETLTIALITVIFGWITQKLIYIFGHKNIRSNNIFYKNRNSIIFYGTLFLIGVLVHIFVKYAQINEWYCMEKCDDGVCNVICTLPVNGFTKLLITK